MKKFIIFIALSSISVCFITCGRKEEAPDVKQTMLAEPGEFGISRRIWGDSISAQDRVDAAAEVKDMMIDLKGSEKATFETNKGNFTVELYSNDAPQTVTNFVKLSQVGFYDGTIWYRYDPDFLLRGGDPTGTGRGDPGYTIDFEKNSRKHEIGALAMARIGEDMNSASCLFYICLTPQPHLDGSYSVFGKVTGGMDVVYYLRAKDTIRKITITKEQ